MVPLLLLQFLFSDSIFLLQFSFYSLILDKAILVLGKDWIPFRKRESGVKNMANIKSAKKRIGVINKKTAANRRVKNHLKTVLKNFDKAIAENDMAAAAEKLRLAEKKLMQAASKGTIHKNAASRKVSRLYKQFNKAKAQ